MKQEETKKMEQNQPTPKAELTFVRDGFWKMFKFFLESKKEQEVLITLKVNNCDTHNSQIEGTYRIFNQRTSMDTETLTVEIDELLTFLINLKIRDGELTLRLNSDTKLSFKLHYYTPKTRDEFDNPEWLVTLSTHDINYMLRVISSYIVLKNVYGHDYILLTMTYSGKKLFERITFSKLLPDSKSGHGYFVNPLENPEFKNSQIYEKVKNCNLFLNNQNMQNIKFRLATISKQIEFSLKFFSKEID